MLSAQNYPRVYPRDIDFKWLWQGEDDSSIRVKVRGWWRRLRSQPSLTKNRKTKQARFPVIVEVHGHKTRLKHQLYWEWPNGDTRERYPLWKRPLRKVEWAQSTAARCREGTKWAEFFPVVISSVVTGAACVTSKLAVKSGTNKHSIKWGGFSLWFRQVLPNGPL